MKRKAILLKNGPWACTGNRLCLLQKTFSKERAHRSRINNYSASENKWCRFTQKKNYLNVIFTCTNWHSLASWFFQMFFHLWLIIHFNQDYHLSLTFKCFECLNITLKWFNYALVGTNEFCTARVDIVGKHFLLFW